MLAEIRPIIWDGKTLKLLDQRLLPRKEEYFSCSTPGDVIAGIKDMIVRGAPAIGVAAAFGMYLAARDILDQKEENFTFFNFMKEYRKWGDNFKKIRPTAVNLAWAVNRMLNRVKDLQGVALENILDILEEEAINIYNEDVDTNKKIGHQGAKLIRNGSTILTHCNAGALATAGYGTALGVVRSAFEQGKKIHIFADETRPFLQGSRLTAWELKKEGIPVTVIVDSAAGYYLNSGIIDCVIVGADRIAANGDVANKIGTYMLAVLARENKVPFYVAAPCSTIDISICSGRDIIIEERGADEVAFLEGIPLAPPGISIKNPAFDVTPASLITALITEYGIIYFPNKKKIERFLQGRCKVN